MNLVSFYSVIILAGIIGILGGVFLSCYEDGKPHGLWYRLRCRLNKHIFSQKGVRKIKCQHCQALRPNLHLTAIDGGMKRNKSTFKL